MRNGRRQQLQTFDAVVEALGGAREVGRLTDKDTAAVCNWKRRRGRFPAKYYPEMKKELEARGFDAALDLWSFYKRETKKRATVDAA